MSKNKSHTRPSPARTPVKTAASRSKRNGLNDARETKKFFVILGICTLLLTFFLYLIFMRSSS
jgi:uncharacterized membrane protein